MKFNSYNNYWISISTSENVASIRLITYPIMIWNRYRFGKKTLNHNGIINDLPSRNLDGHFIAWKSIKLIIQEYSWAVNLMSHITSELSQN